MTKKRLLLMPVLCLFFILLSYSAYAADDTPIGREKSSDDIFEKTGGYFHPFLGITGYYTDNIFNTKDDRESDFVTVLSPGIFITVPRVKEFPTAVGTLNMTPGGVPLTRFVKRYPGSFQSHVIYKADIELFSRNSSENAISHIAEGSLQYNFRGGLSVDVMDQFTRSYNARGSGVFFELDEFNANLFNVMLNYEISDRTVLRFDYSNYYVKYDASRNDFRDRTDNSFSGYLFYKVRLRLAVFGQYEFVDIKYDKDITSGGNEHHFFGGVKWDITAKTIGLIKVGYGIKDFDDSSLNKSNDLLFEAQIDYKFTPKTSVSLVVSRRTNETDIATSDHIASDTIKLVYLQRFTNKITGTVDLSYTSDDYRGELTLDGETKEPKSRYYKAGIAFQYEFKDWLKAGAGYSYTKRDSNFRSLDYNTNMIFLRLMAIL
ncbi:MAG: outer membrane beta-barrel protein [Thermodesulfovibrionales bacterium]|nr:outer membrane beta-barrel protein [Thermodesulfovibrionales bacterium]